jgi:two-component system, OmpR family, alkaline phosphatase synthesis response regulator PhoP
MEKILLVEDEKNISDIIQLNLEMEGYEVLVCANGRKALDIIKGNNFDLLILDVMLPEMDGFSICNEVRKTNKKVPVLFLTAKNDSEDRVKGLKLGADDYLAKPFNLEELLLRVHNLVKKYRSSVDLKEEEIKEFNFGGNQVNFLTYEARGLGEKNYPLSKKEAQLLKLLFEKKNQVVSRDEILDKIWGDDAFPSSRTIDNFILVFRKYFEENPREPRFFHSVRGVGYKFTE